jgi:pyruvate/2-oxoglutarate/acetoin dehydrogenase E1 component
MKPVVIRREWTSAVRDGRSSMGGLRGIICSAANLPFRYGLGGSTGRRTAQHSQAFHTLFSHIPGPVDAYTPYDARAMIAAIRINPVIYIDDRWIQH